MKESGQARISAMERIFLAITFLGVTGLVFGLLLALDTLISR